jgi:hypothetical protein
VKKKRVEKLEKEKTKGIAIELKKKTMDPDRVRAYLQVACAGLGFDIGEIWWTHNDNGSSSALAAIGKENAFSFAWI